MWWKKSMSSTEIQYLLTVNTDSAEISMTRLESGLIRLSSEVKRLTGNDSINSIITLEEKVLYSARSIQRAITATSMALAGAGPVGWLIMGVDITAAALATTDLMTQSQM
jgi:hypothetical protein